jgi:hypothetical protein
MLSTFTPAYAYLPACRCTHAACTLWRHRAVSIHSMRRGHLILCKRQRVFRMRWGNSPWTKRHDPTLSSVWTASRGALHEGTFLARDVETSRKTACVWNRIPQVGFAWTPLRLRIPPIYHRSERPSLDHRVPLKGDAARSKPADNSSRERATQTSRLAESGVTVPRAC